MLKKNKYIQHKNNDQVVACIWELHSFPMQIKPRSVAFLVHFVTGRKNPLLPAMVGKNSNIQISSKKKKRRKKKVSFSQNFFFFCLFQSIPLNRSFLLCTHFPMYYFFHSLPFSIHICSKQKEDIY